MRRVARGYGQISVVLVLLGGAGCDSDDTSTTPDSGTSDLAAGTEAGGTGGTNDGTAGGSTGTGGAPDGAIVDGQGGADAPADVPAACGVPGVVHTVPSVPAAIAAPEGVTLIGGYRAAGNQIYTCTPSASDGGAEAGDEGGAPAGTWVNTANATLYGDACSIAGQHSYAPGPTWTASDGSVVKASRLAASPAPSAEGGDGGPGAIAWVLLEASSTTGTGLFEGVTYVQRTDTAGGVGPSGNCDPSSDAAGTVTAPYEATYYFYKGGAVGDGSADAADAHDGD